MDPFFSTKITAYFFQSNFNKRQITLMFACLICFSNNFNLQNFKKKHIEIFLDFCSYIKHVSTSNISRSSNARPVQNIFSTNNNIFYFVFFGITLRVPNQRTKSKNLINWKMGCYICRTFQNACKLNKRTTKPKLCGNT